jgi:very-short-patch-repair endonuclease
MTSPSTFRDIGSIPRCPRPDHDGGRMYVVVVGIDHYRAWDKLSRAVSDARGARDVFVKLGFTELRPALLNGAATGAALHRLVTDELRALGNDDSLVLFFAGHGHTVPTRYADGTIVKQGYLIPSDADPPGSRAVSWVNLDAWLHDVARLPPKHILVVLDACHSGIALSPVIRWRGEDVRRSEPLSKLRGRRSRRIITSALDDELAMDSGPIEGHSLFTGCLVEALTGGLQAKTNEPTATGSELAVHVQRRVSSFPGCRQTPDFGALELDNRGELIIALSDPHEAVTEPLDRVQHLGVDGVLPRKYQSGTGWPRVASRAAVPTPRDPSTPPRPSSGSGVDSIRPKRRKTDPSGGDAAAGQRDGTARTNIAVPDSSVDATSTLVTQATMATSPAVELPPPAPAQPASAGSTPLPATEADVRSTVSGTSVPTTDNGRNHPPRRFSPAESAFMAALDRHQAERRRGHRVLTLVKADPMTGATAWANWAASRGQLTLVTDATGISAATSNLLEQMPWLRMLRSARARLAATAKLDINAVDEALDRRSPRDREAWIDEVAGHDMHARVSGWLLSIIREPWGREPDPSTAPIQGSDLLIALCGLTAPISLLFHHAEPTASWLERAIQTAAEFVEILPHCAIGINAPSELGTSVLRGRTDVSAFAMAQRGEVPLAARTHRVMDTALGRIVQELHSALSRDLRTSGLFEPSVSVPTHDRDRVPVDLIARDALLAIEIDDWYQFHDPNAYTRDRAKDVWLSRAHFFVMRFLIEDVEDRLDQTIDEIAIGIAGRRASGAFLENSNGQ